MEKIKTFEEYQDESRKTAIFPPGRSLEYLFLGICGETGEIAEKAKSLSGLAGEHADGIEHAPLPARRRAELVQIERRFHVKPSAKLPLMIEDELPPRFVAADEAFKQRRAKKIAPNQALKLTPKSGATDG